MSATVFCQPVTCVYCAGPLTLLNSRASEKGTHSVAILECEPCEKEFEFTACLRYHAVSARAAARQAAAKGEARDRARAKKREMVSA